MKVEIKNAHCENPNEFNFIIVNEHFRSGDDVLFFGNDEKVIFIECPMWHETGDRPIDIYDLLVFANIFPSKGIARKNWHRSGIPLGFEQFKNIGKLKRLITVLLPMKD